MKQRRFKTANVLLVPVGIGLSLLCAVAGFYGALMLAGLGICEIPLSGEIVSGVLLASLLLPFVAGVCLRGYSWVPVLLFDLPMILPLFSDGWARHAAAISCMIAAICAARFGCHIRELNSNRPGKIIT